MYVQRVTSSEKLLPYRFRWDELAGDCVFRTWIWLTTWWKHYGEGQNGRELSVFLVFDGSEPACRCKQRDDSCCDSSPEPDRLLAILPCYRQETFTKGAVLRLLGDGEICSDHLDLLAAEEHIESAANALAEYLVRHSEDWDLADFTDVDDGRNGLNRLVSALQARHCRVTKTPGQNCWLVALPDTWEEFLALQSKSHRKQLRRQEKRVLQSNRASWHLVEKAEQFEQAWEILVDLHQRRRNSMNEPGCFASKSWADFHQDVARRLFEEGRLRLSWLELDGKPIAVEYNFTSDTTTYGYQGGLDPDRLDEGPGSLSLICTFQRAISEGHTTFDLLRGDEPYKAHWRATPQPTNRFQIVSTRGTSRLRYHIWNSIRQAGRFAQQVTHLLG